MNVLKFLSDYWYQKKNAPPKVVSIDETINIILERKCSVSRFGDGEFNLILNSNDLGFQKLDDDLSLRLREILVSVDNNLLVCLPSVFRFDDLKNKNINARKYWIRFLYNKRKVLYKYFSFTKIYGDAFITRNYIDLNDKSNCDGYFKKMKQIWHNRDIVIVEGRYTRFGVGNNLLDNAKSIKRILCPEKNAWDVYENILSAVLQQDKDALYLLALGPTATVLAADLCNVGLQAFDIGHLDLEYEWFLKKVNKKVNVKNKYGNETKNVITEEDDDFKDNDYDKQIVMII